METPVLVKEVRVNLNEFWDEAMLTNEKAAQILRLNKNTISSYRNGNVKNPKIHILINFRNLLSQRIGREISLEDLLETKLEEE